MGYLWDDFWRWKARTYTDGGSLSGLPEIVTSISCMSLIERGHTSSLLKTEINRVLRCFKDECVFTGSEMGFP